MDDNTATRTCGQCHKEVAEVNFALHETHCRRFLSLCPDCDEAVPKEQMNQHREEQHTQVRCPKCNQKMEHRHLMDHESDECQERLEACRFCELQLPWKEMDTHRLFCGSRTELCGDCNRYVQLRDQPEHGLTCSASPRAASALPTKTNITVSCRGCMASFPVEDIEKHELECVTAYISDHYGEAEPEDEEREDRGGVFGQATGPRLSSTYKATALSHGPRSGSWVHRDGGDPDRISTCPHCHLALPLFTLRWHEAKCQIHILLK